MNSNEIAEQLVKSVAFQAWSGQKSLYGVFRNDTDTWVLSRTQGKGWHLSGKLGNDVAVCYTTPSRTVREDGELSIKRLVFDIDKVQESIKTRTERSRTKLLV